jgi:hypothetical protein
MAARRARLPSGRTKKVTIPERSRPSVTTMNGQLSRSKLEMRNKIFVVWPVGVATICLGLVVPGLVSPLWGVVLGLGMVVLLWVAWIFALVLADRSGK